MKRTNIILFAGSFLLPAILAARSSLAVDLAEDLAAFPADVLTKDERRESASMIERDLRRRRDAANTRNRAEWAAIDSREDWDTYKKLRLARLKRSLGNWPEAPNRLNTRTTATVEGDGFVIENVIYESRPGDWVAGNLYRPAKPTKSMPGILISHAHHRGKDQGELQDMGMTWARAGCMVLVIDQAGYGERRAHPFNGPKDYPEANYRHSRQDYYHRYDSGIQLHLAGESLMGWMVWDQMRGVDLLLSRDGIDPKRIIMLGAVAGGGDPCGITAALDERVAAAVPFNFGGPQPETIYPLPDDADSSFNYLMGSYWESTRGLRRTAADGFFHWLIAASIAPRRLIHAHEFSWDRQRDPVWKRYERIYGEFYKQPENLAFAHGKGLLQGKSPGASHCGQIGRFHRRMIHPVFRRWFHIDVKEEDEFSARRESGELVCLTPEARKEVKPAGLVQIAAETGKRRVTEARARLDELSPAERRKSLREQWGTLLGDLTLQAPPKVKTSTVDKSGIRGAHVQRVVLEVEQDVVIPLLLIYSAGNLKPSPAVVTIAQAGKRGFLEHRSAQLTKLIEGGAVVCLPDLRGTGETRAATSRGRTSGDTNRSVNVLLHDQTLLGQRLRDLQSVVAWLRGLEQVDGKRISLWGDSFAPVNPQRTNFKIPRGVDGRPHQSEPMGGLLALFGALFDDGIQRVYIRGGLSSYSSVLTHFQVYLPHDAVVPGALTASDLCDVAAALAPRPIRFDALVDGRNQTMSPAKTTAEYKPARDHYQRLNAARRFVIGGSGSPAQWLLAE